MKPVSLGVNRPPMMKVTDQCDVDAGVIPASLLEKSELVEELLGGMFMATISGIDKHRSLSTDTISILSKLLLQRPANAFPF